MRSLLPCPPCGRQGRPDAGTWQAPYHEPRGSAPRERDHRGGDHPVPSRTRQLSPPSPRVLQRKAAGGQGVALAEGAFLCAPREARKGYPCWARGRAIKPQTQTGKHGRSRGALRRRYARSPPRRRSPSAEPPRPRDGPKTREGPQGGYPLRAFFAFVTVLLRRRRAGASPPVGPAARTACA